jgi:SAM-dependent methyltransferase
MRASSLRPDQALRSSGESWKPISCADVSPIRRFFDLQAGTIWRDLAAILPTLTGCVVDVGCGAQPYRRLLRSAVEYVGIDTYDAKAVFGYEMPGTTYYDGVTWPLDPWSADAVLATETLEHVKEPTTFLREAYRVLRPSGKIVLTVPFSARWHYIPLDYWRFTPSGLRFLLEACGFDEVHIYARGNSATVAAYKCLALIAPLLLPQRDSAQASIARLAGIALLPLFVALAIVGNLSTHARTDDDCLGYTVMARKPADHP